MRGLIIALALTLSTTACAGKKPVLLVGQTGVATARVIGQLQDTTKALTGAVIPNTVALGIQEKLLALNDRLKPLPDILRTIDRLQQAGASSQSETEQAIAILQVVGTDISVVLAGVPLRTETQALIEVVRAAQGVVQTALVEIARVKGVQ